MAKTPANSLTFSPSISVICRLKKRTVACAAVRRMVFTAASSVALGRHVKGFGTQRAQSGRQKSVDRRTDRLAPSLVEYPDEDHAETDEGDDEGEGEDVL